MRYGPTTLILAVSTSRPGGIPKSARTSSLPSPFETTRECTPLAVPASPASLPSPSCGSGPIPCRKSVVRSGGSRPHRPRGQVGTSDKEWRAILAAWHDSGHGLEDGRTSEGERRPPGEGRHPGSRPLGVEDRPGDELVAQVEEWVFVAGRVASLVGGCAAQRGPRNWFLLV
jgi:hypothetical protein